MYTMHEALARERMQHYEQLCRHSRLSRELAAVNRWQYLERMAHRVCQRHEQHAARLLATV